MDLSKLTTPKINYLRENLNLTDEELIVFDMLAKHKSQIQIADRLHTCVRTVTNRTRAIRAKMEQLERE